MLLKVDFEEVVRNCFVYSYSASRWVFISSMHFGMSMSLASLVNDDLDSW